MKKLIALTGLLAAVTVFTARVTAESKAPADTVKIDNFSFSPQTLTVRAGTTVTWVNKDDVPHTIASNDKKFKSRVLDTDDRFSHTFSQPGTYEYYCSVHPKMTGKIVVQ